MAFFDQLGNLTPDQNQALLSAASQILQASGPSRIPTSIGQILGGGLQAYQQGLQGAEDRNFQNQVRALQLQELQGSAAEKERARQEEEALRQFYSNRATQAASPLAQAQSVLGSNLAPTQANANSLAAALPTQGAPSAPNIYQDRLQEAQDLRNKGFYKRASAVEQEALKFAPKVKDFKEVQVNGRTLYAPLFEDGTAGKPVQYDAAVKLAFQNTGGQTLGLNPFTGQQVSAQTNTASPESILSAATQRRGQDISAATAIRGQDLTNQRALAAEKAPTEFQGKSATFGLRAEESNKILNNLQGKYNPSAINSKLAFAETPLIGGLLGTAGNALLSSEDQQAEQAQRDFLNATLRQESGAAIGPSEFRNGQLQYFPQPGDSQSVIAQKARNRQLVIQGFKANAGKAALSAAPAAQSGGWSITKVGE